MGFWEGVAFGVAGLGLVQMALDYSAVWLAKRGACPTCKEAGKSPTD